MSEEILRKSVIIRSPIADVFQSLCDNQKVREWFPELYVTETNTSVDIEKLRSYNIQYIVRIEHEIPHSSITGTVESIDNTEDKLNFEWTLEKDDSVKNWTLLTITFVAPQAIIKSKWWGIVTAGGTISLLTLLTNGFSNMSNAYAVTTTTASTTISKNLLVTIIISAVVTAGGGIILGDAYFSDPYVEYFVYPGQMPAELHGVSVTVNDVYSTDDKTEIINYDCNNESIIHELDYSFNCITENSLGNKESIITNVSVREPDNRLGADATQCVEQHYHMLSDDENDITKYYPYLSNLPNVSPSSLSNYKNTHIKLMDDYFTNHDYVNAKKHATIVLKYFSINDVQALSTLGNAMRDKDRNDINGVKCAIIVHSTPFLYSTAWGKLSLAEDHHVLHDFKKAANLATLVIKEYNSENPDIHETTYKNALIVKANALMRMAMAERADDIENVRKHYTTAHEIEPSYDSWFGLGNLDRYVGNFADALEKYEQAKELATDTTEIDYEISVLLSYI